MKKYITILLLTGALLLPSCGKRLSSVSIEDNRQENSQQDKPEDNPKAAINKESSMSPESEYQENGYQEYAAALLENARFFDTKEKAYRCLSDYLPAFFSGKLLNSRYSFFVLDIDSDGIDEVFFEYDSLGSILIFDYEDGIMYGYPFNGREMSCVSIDGSFRCSEAESGWSRINLSQGEYKMIPTTDFDFQSPGAPPHYLFYEENIVEVFLPDEFKQYQIEQTKRASHQVLEQESGAEWEAFKTILSGNFTLIEDKEERQMFQRRYRDNIKYYGECTWRYILLDFNQDGIKDLFIQDDSALGSDSALLYYRDGKVICAYFDTSDYHDFYVPFKDGRLLYIYDYSVTTNEYIKNVNSDFTFTTEKDYLSIRIDYSLYDESYFERFSSNYDAIAGEGEYYFIREYKDGTGWGPEISITDKERIDVELMIDELLIPENEWRYCSDSSIKDSNYEEIFNRLKEKTQDNIYDIFYIDFTSNGIFYCIDPLNRDNVPVPLDEYNNRVYAVRCVYPKYQKTEPETDQTAINEQEDDWQGKLDLDIMPDEPLYIPQTLIQDIEAIILNGEEHDGQCWKGANLGNYNPDGELLEIIHDEIGMFEDIDEFLSRANFYKVDFDNDGYEDIVVHLREGNGRMAMYAWHYLCNDGKGGYRKTEDWPSCMSYGRFIEFEGVNYLIELQDDMTTRATRIFTGIGINYYAEGRLMEHVFLSFGASDKAEVIYDQEGNPLTVTECSVSRRGPVQCSIYTKHVNTLFTDS